jgi:methylenetetrahydrofolate--tRNA-(uracil-5-)-methyltransferase
MPNVEVRRQTFTVSDLNAARSSGDFVVLATGPLTTPELAEWLAETTGRERLYFFDAVSPTVEASSINRDVAFAQSRYDH